MNQVPFEQLTYVRFAALVKTPFRVRTGAGQQVELELAEAREFSSRGVQIGWDGDEERVLLLIV